MRHATCDMQRVAYISARHALEEEVDELGAGERKRAQDEGHAAGNMQHAACNMQHATCSVPASANGPKMRGTLQAVPCNMHHATCNVRSTAINGGQRQHASYNMQVQHAYVTCKMSLCNSPHHRRCRLPWPSMSSLSCFPQSRCRCARLRFARKFREQKFQTPVGGQFKATV